MSKIHETLARLPVRAYVWVENTYGGTIGTVILGQHGYVPYVGPHTIERLRALNEDLGVSPEQAEAMHIGSQYGWHVPGVEQALNGTL